MRRATLPPSWVNYSGASYRLPLALALQARKCSPQTFAFPCHFFLCARSAFSFIKIDVTRQFHHHVGNRISHLLYRLRQPARRKRREEKCHTHLRHLWCHLQRYVCKVRVAFRAESDPNFLRYLLQDCSHTLQTHGLPLGPARKAVRGADPQRRRCANVCPDRAHVRKVWSRRGSLLHSAIARCR
jgi:hypothetical protein